MANKRQRLAKKQFKAAHPPPDQGPTEAEDGAEQKPTNKKLKLERWKKRVEKERAREEREAAKKRLAKPVGSCWVCNENGHWSKDCPLNNRHMTCLGCRGRGHTLKMCPHAVGVQKDLGEGPQKAATKMCYNCGEEGHNLSGCKRPIKEGGTQFATCFVCKQKGHISAACPQNEHGIYPKGGSCKHCGSVRHLAKDCPGKAPKSTVYGKMPPPPAAGVSAKKTVFASGDDLEDDFTEAPAKQIDWGSDAEEQAEAANEGDEDDSDQEREVVLEALGESKNKKRHSVGGTAKVKRRKVTGEDEDVAVPQSAPPKVSRQKAKTVTF